jgi:hypothetical protein
LSDSFVKELMALPFPIITTFDVEPVDTDYASKMLMQKYMSAQRTIDKQQERKNKNGNFSSDVSYDKRKEVEELECRIKRSFKQSCRAGKNHRRYIYT